MPSTDRPLRDAERKELETSAQEIAAELPADAHEPRTILQAVEDMIRTSGPIPDERVFAMGALVAACFEMGLGWELVEVTFASGITALAVVEMDRSLAVLPLLAVDQLTRTGGANPTLSTGYQRLASGERPAGLHRGEYAVLIP